MYHPTEMANTVTPTSWFYSLDIHTPSNEIQRDNPSRLEISFLLDSGASISVLNYPTYDTIAKLLNIKQNSTLNPPKTLFVANQTEVPRLHYVTIILNTTIEDDPRQFTKPFAVADIKYNNLGTLFLRKTYKRQTYKTLHYNLYTIQQYTLTIQNLHHYYPKITHLFHTFIELILKPQIRLKPNS